MSRVFARRGDQRALSWFAQQQVNILGHDETQAAKESGFAWSSALALH
jgi:hypothetical protein